MHLHFPFYSSCSFCTISIFQLLYSSHGSLSAKFQLFLSSHIYPPELRFPVLLVYSPHPWHLYIETRDSVISDLLSFIHFNEEYYWTPLELPDLISGVRKYQHISPTLAVLHWLPIRFRIDFKVLMITYKALNGLGP